MTDESNPYHSPTTEMEGNVSTGLAMSWPKIFIYFSIAGLAGGLIRLANDTLMRCIIFNVWETGQILDHLFKRDTLSIIPDWFVVVIPLGLFFVFGMKGGRRPLPGSAKGFGLIWAVIATAILGSIRFVIYLTSSPGDNGLAYLFFALTGLFLGGFVSGLVLGYLLRWGSGTKAS